jgi:hypothetical protein
MLKPQNLTANGHEGIRIDKLKPNREWTRLPQGPRDYGAKGQELTEIENESAAPKLSEVPHFFTVFVPFRGYSN